MVVQRGFDVEQRTGDVQQRLVLGRPHAVGDFVEDAALLVDHPARHAQRQHAQRIAHALEHLALRGQLGRIGVALAQEQIERFLHP